MKPQGCPSALLIFLLISAVAAQNVTFEGYAAWVTGRTDAVVLKASVDTSVYKKKDLKVTLSKIEKGQKKIIGTKTVVVTSPSVELNLGNVGASILGGKSFLQIDWAINKGVEKGTIVPIGIVDLKKTVITDTLFAPSIDDNAASEKVSSMVSANDYSQIANTRYALCWNKQNLYIVGTANESLESIKITLDCKQGKNAFLSLADRCITIKPSQTAVVTEAFRREFRDTVIYNMAPWINSIKSNFDQNNYTVTIPWSDLGLKPFDKRCIGISVFVKEKEVAQRSYPQNAQEVIPGTWGNLVLKQTLK